MIARIVAATLFALPVAANDGVALPCFQAEDLERMISGYGETALFRGDVGDADVVLFWNPESGSWTIVYYPHANPDAGCPAIDGIDGGSPDMERERRDF